MKAACFYCDEVLTFVVGKGWRHPEGGVYVMRCPECSWEGAPDPSPAVCPECGSTSLRDDHCALPRATEHAAAAIR